jgi:hypothetical protein
LGVVVVAVVVVALPEFVSRVAGWELEAPVEAGAAGFFSLPEERTIATTTPAAAATATAAARRAFFTRSEATLARRCQNRSKTS